VAVRLEKEPAQRGSEGGGGVPVTGVQEGEGELVREPRHGDVVLMVLLAREKKGWNLVRLETGRRRGVRSPMQRFGLRAHGRRKKSGSGRGSEMRRCWWSTKLERRSGGGG
jgi:hypothetical protein